MDTPLEESNLAYIGSDQDKAARQAAAALEVHWEGAGETEGVEIWRVENTRNRHDVPVFGIHKWPKERHGEFYTGECVNTYTQDGIFIVPAAMCMCVCGPSFSFL